MLMRTIATDHRIQPGQRFTTADFHGSLATRELVVNRLVRDGLGMLHIVMRDLEGREISIFAAQVEAAVDAGMLVAIEDIAHASA